MKIAVIGTGYVGLVSGVCFADLGHQVICIDNNNEKIELLRQGRIPIYEPNLEDLIKKNVAAKRLEFSTDTRSAVSGAEAVFIAVGTPPRPGDGEADLQYVYAVAEEIGRSISQYTVVVTKSTVPVGTNKAVSKIISLANPRAEFATVSNPEFLAEGSAVHDFMNPDRVVIGVNSPRARKVMEDIYEPLAKKEVGIYFTGVESAEMIKYASNAFLATKITFINEIAALCEKVGANVKEVSKGVGLDSRIGNKFLRAGPGYGGSCFPKDTKALVSIGRNHASPIQIVETVVRVNSERMMAMVGKVAGLCDGRLEGKKIAVLGVTYKPNTNDMRDSPALTIVPALQRAGAVVHATDPEGREEGEKLLPNVVWHEDAYSAANGSDVIVVMTEWKQFAALELEKLAAGMKVPRLADLRNIFDPELARNHGFAYVGVGTA